MKFAVIDGGKNSIDKTFRELHRITAQFHGFDRLTPRQRIQRLKGVEIELALQEAAETIGKIQRSLNGL